MSDKSVTLTLTYSTTTVEPSVTLEQKAVADDSLTTDDLYTMLSLVRSGISAKTYKPATCDVTIVDGNVKADLIIYAWPKPLTLDYQFVTNYGTLGNIMAVSQNREFDFVINLSTKTELPFIVSDIEYSLTQLPFFNSRGEIVEAPTITFDERFVYTDAEVIGVIRIVCVANGFQHTDTISFPKGTGTVSGVNINTSATWYNTSAELQTEKITLDIPGCMDQLLTECMGTLLSEKNSSSVKSDSEKIPKIYYSTCDGSVLGVVYVKP